MEYGKYDRLCDKLSEFNSEFKIHERGSMSQYPNLGYAFFHYSFMRVFFSVQAKERVIFVQYSSIGEGVLFKFPGMREDVFLF